MHSEQDKQSGISYKIKNQILWTVAVILFIYLIYFVVVNAGKETHGFASYYTASKLLLSGENVSMFYNDDLFSERVKEFVPGVYEIYHVNTPAMSLVTLPFVVFDFITAKVFWTIINLLVLALTTRFLLTWLKFDKQRSLLTIIMILCFQPLYANVFYGQIYLLIFCLLIFAGSAYSSGNYKLLGIILGFIIVIKLAGLILLVLLIVQKKWRSLVWTFIIMTTMVVISFSFVGVESWFVYAESLMKYFSSPTLSVTAYQTVHSFFSHLTEYDQQWNPEPLINLPLLGKVLIYLSTIVVLGAICYFANKIKNADLTFGIFIIAGIILSPASLDYHYIIILIPLMIFIKNFYPVESGWIHLGLIMVYVLIAAAIPYTSPKVTGGFLSVFAYPKLYGAVGLLVLFFLSAFGLFQKQKNISGHN